MQLKIRRQKQSKKLGGEALTRPLLNFFKKSCLKDHENNFQFTFFSENYLRAVYL